MKHLKTYEDLDEHKIGDYAISINNELWNGRNKYKEYDIFINFINNNIGKIIDKIDSYGVEIYLVKYDNMPISIDNWLNMHGGRDDSFKTKNNYQKNTVKFTSNDKNFFSGDTIEDLEYIIMTRKYNL